MWKCLTCIHLNHTPQIIYDEYDDDPETLKCEKGHFYITEFTIPELKIAVEKGSNCIDFVQTVLTL